MTRRKRHSIVVWLALVLAGRTGVEGQAGKGFSRRNVAAEGLMKADRQEREAFDRLAVEERITAAQVVFELSDEGEVRADRSGIEVVRVTTPRRKPQARKIAFKKIMVEGEVTCDFSAGRRGAVLQLPSGIYHCSPLAAQSTGGGGEGSR